MQTFYAVDIKALPGNTMTRFAIEESDNGVSFRKVGNFELNKKGPGVV